MASNTIKSILLKNGTTVYKAYAYMGINPDTGKKIRTTITRNNYKAVETELNRIAFDRDNKRIDYNTSLTFNDLYNEWLDIYKTTVKPTTVETVTSKFKVNILPYFRYRKLKKITPQICQSFINSLSENTKLSRTTVKDLQMYTKMLFRFALKKEYLLKNPMEYVTVPKEREDFFYNESDEIMKRKYFTKEETLTFLKIAKNEFQFYDYVIVKLLLFTGMRKGELQALHWNDLDLDTGEIIINKTLAEIGGSFVLQKPKTKSSSRKIYIDPSIINLLKQWKKDAQNHLYKTRTLEKWNNNIPVFINVYGNYLPLSHLNNLMNENFYKKHPDFQRITVHGFRHTHASLLFESGATLKDVQAKLGHSDIQTTMNIYTHVTESKDKKTLDNFASFMSN